jgi:hypothetical protein
MTGRACAIAFWLRVHVPNLSVRAHAKICLGVGIHERVCVCACPEILKKFESTKRLDTPRRLASPMRLAFNWRFAMPMGLTLAP